MTPKKFNYAELPSATMHFVKVLSIIVVSVIFTLPLMLHLTGDKSEHVIIYHVVEILTIPLAGALLVWWTVVLPLRRAAISDLNGKNEALNKLEGMVSLLEATLESTADGIIVLDMDKRIVAYNQKYLEMWKLPSNAMESRDAYQVFDYIEPLLSDPEWFKNRSLEIYENRIQDVRDVIHLKDGRIFERLSRPQKIDEKRVGTVSSYRDVTERMLSIQALKDSEANFRQIFEQMDTAKIIFDSEMQTTLDLNPAAERLFRCDKAKLVQKHPQFFFSREDHEKILCQLRENNGSQSFQVGCMKLLVGDGMEVYLSVQGSCIELCGTKVLLCAFNDISERIRMDRQTREIEAKLIQTNKMTSLGVLVTGITHDINNPNNYILVNSELLFTAWKDIHVILADYYEKNGEFPVGGIPYTTMRNEIPGMLDSIREGAIRIRDIVDTLKDYARDGKGEGRNDIDMNRVVTHVTTIIRHQIARHTEHFTLETTPELPRITGNLQQLEQVIINLVLNAIQSLPSPDRGVCVSTYFDSSTDNVCVEVADQGSGIPTEIADKIMEPFFTTRLDNGGTGLGLSMSQVIIKAHKGKLTFTSSPGHGSKFLVQLPATSIPNRGDTL